MRQASSKTTRQLEWSYWPEQCGPCGPAGDCVGASVFFPKRQQNRKRGVLVQVSEGVQAGLVDDRDTGLTAITVLICHSIQVERGAAIVVNVLCKRCGNLGCVVQSLTSISGNKPWLTFLEDGTQGQVRGSTCTPLRRSSSRSMA